MSNLKTSLFSISHTFPVAFAQVREDPEIDAAIAAELDYPASMMMVASGGCTAALLSRHPHLSHLTLVDTNPAQLVLTRLKLQLLAETSPPDRLRLLGYSDLEPQHRQRELERYFRALDVLPDALGPLESVARWGPDYCGRYEQLFVVLQSAIASDPELNQGIQSLLVGSQRVMSPELWSRLSLVFDEVFALPNLVTLFGEEATKNPRRLFSSHFFERLQTILTRQDLSQHPQHSPQNNSFIWQFLRGASAPHGQHASWLDLPCGPILTTINEMHAPMHSALQDVASRGKQYNIIHLSNILDWLDTEAALTMLRLAWHCTAPGGWLVIRQLNSSLDIRGLGEAVSWQWDTRRSEALHVQDKSFFYSALHIGRKY